jgi:hypothetical protein
MMTTDLLKLTRKGVKHALYLILSRKGDNIGVRRVFELVSMPKSFLKM